MEQKNFDWRNEAVNSRMIPYRRVRDPKILELVCGSCGRSLHEHVKRGVAAKSWESEIRHTATSSGTAQSSSWSSAQSLLLWRSSPVKVGDLVLMSYGDYDSGIIRKIRSDAFGELLFDVELSIPKRSIVVARRCELIWVGRFS